MKMNEIGLRLTAYVSVLVILLVYSIKWAFN